MNSYVIIPRAIYDALERDLLNPDHVTVLTYCYIHASRPEYRVAGFSAANVCRFQHLDATQANLKRFQRATLDLLNWNLIRRDYFHANPQQGQKTRPYNVWVPNPDNFAVVGTAEENSLSLFGAIVAQRVSQNVTDNVAQMTDANAENTITSVEMQSDNVAQDVATNVAQRPHNLSIKDQGAPQTRERDPLNPPSGDFSPAPLPLKGENAPAGVVQNIHRESKAAGKKTSLDAKQCAALDDAVTLYIAVAAQLFGFSPNEEFTHTLLRVYMPTELLFAHMHKISGSERMLKTTLNHFYSSAARLAIDAARLEKTSTQVPDFILCNPVTIWSGVAATWTKVLENWNVAAPLGQHDDGFPDPVVAAQQRAAECQRQRKQTEAKRIEDEAVANQARLVKRAADEAQRTADRLAYERDFKLRAEEDAAKEVQRIAAEKEKKERRFAHAVEFVKTILQDGAFHAERDINLATYDAAVDPFILAEVFASLRCISRVLTATMFTSPLEWRLPTSEELLCVEGAE